MQLVGLAMTKWAPHVPDRAFRVLMRMALTALDTPQNGRPANIFNGGRDLLASVLRAERDGSEIAIDKALKRAIADLVKVGAIRLTNRPRAGVRAIYELTLNNAIRIDEPLVDNSAQGDTSGTPEGDTRGTPQGDTSGPIRGTLAVPPRRQEETYKEQDQETGGQVTPPLTVRARDAPTTPKDDPKSKCADPTCVMGYALDPQSRTNIRCPSCNPPTNVLPFRKGKSA